MQHNFDSLEEWNEKLVESTAHILVEGQNDQRKLRKLGVDEQRILLVSSKPVYKVVEELKNEKEVIILTDLDYEGKKLYNKLRHHLQKNGKRIDNRFRNFLFQETTISNIEGITV